MISMSNMATDAVKKITDEKKKVTGSKETVMADAVFAAVKDFCVQEEEFAQAVLQGGTFADCMRTVAKGVGRSISDLEAYKRAVQFYFPGAEVKMQLTIDLIGAAAGEDPKQNETAAQPGMILELADFFK